MNTNLSNNFAFSCVTNERVSAKLQEPKIKKSSSIGSIPGNILKDNSDIFNEILQELFNASIVVETFPTQIKKGEVTSVFKANDQVKKENYRSINILSAISKVYKCLMFERIIIYSESFLFQYLCGFLEGYNTQKAFKRFLEKCKSVLDNKGFAGAILMDLSKAFDCLNHELLIAKLSAYGFSQIICLRNQL